jgi:hypothetical protein
MIPGSNSIYAHAVDFVVSVELLLSILKAFAEVHSLTTR